MPWHDVEFEWLRIHKTHQKFIRHRALPWLFGWRHRHSSSIPAKTTSRVSYSDPSARWNFVGPVDGASSRFTSSSSASTRSKIRKSCVKIHEVETIESKSQNLNINSEEMSRERRKKKKIMKNVFICSFVYRGGVWWCWSCEKMSAPNEERKLFNYTQFLYKHSSSGPGSWWACRGNRETFFVCLNNEIGKQTLRKLIKGILINVKLFRGISYYAPLSTSASRFRCLCNRETSIP